MTDLSTLSDHDLLLAAFSKNDPTDLEIELTLRLEHALIELAKKPEVDRGPNP